jgi:hypothetical protein
MNWSLLWRCRGDLSVLLQVKAVVCPSHGSVKHGFEISLFNVQCTMFNVHLLIRS